MVKKLAENVANYPGFREITGLELTDRMIEQVKDYDVPLLEKTVTKVDQCEEGCFKVFPSDGYLHTKAIVFATGTVWRKLNVPGEAEFTGRGVHYCALCDGAFYKPYNGSNELTLDALFVKIGTVPLSQQAQAIGVMVTEQEGIEEFFSGLERLEIALEASTNYEYYLLRSPGEPGASRRGGASVEDADDRGADAKIKTGKIDARILAERRRGSSFRRSTIC